MSKEKRGRVEVVVLDDDDVDEEGPQLKKLKSGSRVADGNAKGTVKQAAGQAGGLQGRGKARSPPSTRAAMAEAETSSEEEEEEEGRDDDDFRIEPGEGEDRDNSDEDSSDETSGGNADDDAEEDTSEDSSEEDESDGGGRGRGRRGGSSKGKKKAKKTSVTHKGRHSGTRRSSRVVSSPVKATRSGSKVNKEGDGVGLKTRSGAGRQQSKPVALAAPPAVAHPVARKKIAAKGRQGSIPGKRNARGSDQSEDEDEDSSSDEGSPISSSDSDSDKERPLSSPGKKAPGSGKVPVRKAMTQPAAKKGGKAVSPLKGRKAPKGSEASSRVDQKAKRGRERSDDSSGEKDSDGFSDEERARFAKKKKGAGGGQPLADKRLVEKEVKPAKSKGVPLVSSEPGGAGGSGDGKAVATRRRVMKLDDFDDLDY